MADTETIETGNAQDNTEPSPGTGAEEASATETKEATDDSLLGGNQDDSVKDESLLGEEDKPQESDKPQGAPEKYEQFNLPDGFEIPEESFNAFSEAFTELGLTQEQAQRLVDEDVKRQQSAMQADRDAINKQVETWRTDIKKEFGEGFPEAQQKAKYALNTYFSKELVAELDKLYLLDNPDLFRALHKIGGTISEDSIVTGDSRVKGKNEGGVKSMFNDLNENKI